jgi:hypothetical protein
MWSCMEGSIIVSDEASSASTCQGVVWQTPQRCIGNKCKKRDGWWKERNAHRRQKELDMKYLSDELIY